MKTKEWVNPNRMKINSGVKAFDLQTSAISAGNVIGGTQFSSHIRPYDETYCNGDIYELGHLRRFDLKHFKNLPPTIVKWYENNPSTKTILYQFFHYNGNTKVIHGYVITDTDYKFITKWCNGRIKSLNVIDECISYITEIPE